MANAIEAYYSVSKVALLLDFSTKWVTAQVLAGAFGRCIRLGDGKTADYRIPASGINAWIARHSIGGPVSAAVDEPVRARTEGELRRKCNGHPEVVA